MCNSDNKEIYEKKSLPKMTLIMFFAEAAKLDSKKEIKRCSDSKV